MSNKKQKLESIEPMILMSATVLEANEWDFARATAGDDISDATWVESNFEGNDEFDGSIVQNWSLGIEDLEIATDADGNVVVSKDGFSTQTVLKNGASIQLGGTTYSTTDL